MKKLFISIALIGGLSFALPQATHAEEEKDDGGVARYEIICIYNRATKQTTIKFVDGKRVVATIVKDKDGNVVN